MCAAPVAARTHLYCVPGVLSWLSAPNGAPDTHTHMRLQMQAYYEMTKSKSVIGIRATTMSAATVLLQCVYELKHTHTHTQLCNRIYIILGPKVCYNLRCMRVRTLDAISDWCTGCCQYVAAAAQRAHGCRILSQLTHVCSSPLPPHTHRSAIGSHLSVVPVVRCRFWEDG